MIVKPDAESWNRLVPDKDMKLAWSSSRPEQWCRPPSLCHTYTLMRTHTHAHTQLPHTHGSSSQNDSSRGLFPSLCLSINTENVGKGGRKAPKGLKKRMTAAHAPNSSTLGLSSAFSSPSHRSHICPGGQIFPNHSCQVFFIGVIIWDTTRY